MTRWSDEVIEETLRVFQPRTKRELTRKDAREIYTNVVGAFSILLERQADAQGSKRKQRRDSR